MSLLAISDLTAVHREQLDWDVSPDEAGRNFLHVPAIVASCAAFQCGCAAYRVRHV
jgi:hypothetical protein